MINLPDVAIGSIGAALIAGLVFFLCSILSKELKTSDFRQAWIDALREDVSKFIANANVMAGFRAVSDSNATHYQVFKDKHESYSAINEAESIILMRLNPREELSKAVLNTLKEHEAILSYKVTDIDYEAITNIQKKLVLQMNEIFKEEWKRVKRGELLYVITKYFIGFAILAAALYEGAHFIFPKLLK